MKSLEEYILQDLLNRSEENEDTIDSVRDCLTGTNDQLKHALSKFFVGRNSLVSSLPSVTSTEHASVIDECIQFLINNRSNNVLTYGYKVGKNGDVLSTFHCESTNFGVSVLKCGVWITLHKILGTRHFVDLVVNSIIFEFKDGTFQQITGPAHEHPVRSERNVHATVGNSSFLYRTKGQFKVADIIPPTVSIFWLDIFYSTELSGYTRKHLEPRCAYLRTILRQVIRNHKRLKYRLIFQTLCTRRSLENFDTNQELQTSVKSVIKFLTVILGKLFPLDFFGSKHNKSVLLSKISALVKLNLHSRISVDLLVEGIKIKDLRWLGKRSKIDSKETTKRRDILKVVFQWLFGKFLPSLISSFFYCTEISSTQDILFFNFDVWSQMTQPFLTSYFESFLCINKICSDHGNNNKFTHGYLRLAPKTKKNDFRVIFVPLKLKSSDQLNTQPDRTHNTVKPVGNLLNYMLSKTEDKKKSAFSNRLHSPLGIKPAVSQFKRYLAARYQEFPQLFFIKFDIQSCYDSIPRSMAKNVIKTTVEAFPEFYIRSYSFYDSKRDVFKQRYSVNGELASESRTVSIDNVRTTYLSRDDVLSVLDDQMHNCSIIHSGSCYLRKAGIFQGASLSANIVDFLYNDMIDKEEAFSDDSEEKLLLRLADDFLAISTSQDYVAKLERQVRQGFKRYNAFANPHKIVSNLENSTTKLRFCAIDVDLGIS
ncbi:LAFA_0E07470g1_1 [Lachancea sp. 'fantastica']|nr:LAFA_0E07470g1_1 [Lachancea sp. 'fantastica']